jgi:hypothetical protein
MAIFREKLRASILFLSGLHGLSALVYALNTSIFWSINNKQSIDRIIKKKIENKENDEKLA